MDPTIPWYQSAIIRQQVVQLIVAAVAFFGIATDVDWSATVEAIFAGVAAAVAVWTIITRLFKPAPNITAAAAAKEQTLVAKGAIPKQGGFARIGVLLMLGFVGLGALPFVSGCTGMQAAMREAKGNPADTAYVVTEAYSAVLHEAADLREQPGTPASIVTVLQQADQVMKPFIVGDPAREIPSLQDLANTYQAVGGAKTEADLQTAVNNAIRELAKFSRAVKAAKVQVNQ